MADARKVPRTRLTGILGYAGSVIVLLALNPSTGFATCPGISQPLFHGLGGFLENCFEPTKGFAYARTTVDPFLHHSNDIDFVCDEAGVQTPPQNRICQNAAGTASDGKVTVNFNYGASGGVVGCPNPAGLPGVGRNIVHVVANDGSALLLSVGFNTVTASYILEAAHPYDQPTDTILPLSCGAPGTQSLTVDNVSSGGGNFTIDVTVSAPLIFSDCDAGSWGEVVFPTCTEGSGPVTARGDIYSRVAACGSTPDLSLVSGWIFAASPAADGTATIVLPAPTPGCLYLGATYTIAAEESPAIAEFNVVAVCSDTDGDSVTDCEGDCDDLDPDVFPGQTESCNGIDDDCNGLIDDDADGMDSDGDAVPNVCDNCPITPNAAQADADSDGEGDLCDLDDGLFVIDLLDANTIVWHDELQYRSFNLYRSDLLFLLASAIYTQDPSLVPMAMRECNVRDPQFTDTFVPPVGQAVVYWVTGNDGGTESSLDTDSSGNPRPNDNPC